MRVLITGMSGVGKSAVVAELVRRGVRAIDTDDGWCIAQSDGTQLWDIDRLRALLADDDVVIAGCEENMGELVPMFDRVVLLTAPLDTMRARIAARTNPWGKRDSQWQQVVRDTNDVVPLLRNIADIEIDTSGSLADVVDVVVAELGRDRE